MERHHLVLLLLAVLAGNASAAEPAVAGSASIFSSGAEWLSYNKSLDGQRYSPLTQINRTNAAEGFERSARACGVRTLLCCLSWRAGQRLAERRSESGQAQDERRAARGVHVQPTRTDA